MPVTRRGNLYDNIDQTNAAGFLFRDDEAGLDPHRHSAIDTSAEDGYPGAGTYVKKGNSNMVSRGVIASTAREHGAPCEATGVGTSRSFWSQPSTHHSFKGHCSFCNSS